MAPRNILRKTGAMESTNEVLTGPVSPVRRAIGRKGEGEELGAGRPCALEEDALRLGCGLLAGRGGGAGGLGEFSEHVDEAGLEGGAEGVVERAELEIDEGVVEAGHAAAGELVAEAVPGPLGGGAEFAPVEKDVALVGVEIEAAGRGRRCRWRGGGTRGR